MANSVLNCRKAKKICTLALGQRTSVRARVCPLNFTTYSQLRTLNPQYIQFTTWRTAKLRYYNSLFISFMYFARHLFGGVHFFPATSLVFSLTFCLSWKGFGRLRTCNVNYCIIIIKHGKFPCGHENCLKLRAIEKIYTSHQFSPQYTPIPTLT